MNCGNSHKFCFPCVSAWAKITNRCALCRGRFTEIQRHVSRGRKGKHIEVVKVEDRDQVVESDIPFDYDLPPGPGCAHCGSTEEPLLTCEQCQVRAHIYCLNPPLRYLPPFWLCAACDADTGAGAGLDDIPWRRKAGRDSYDFSDGFLVPDETILYESDRSRSASPIPLNDDGPSRRPRTRAFTRAAGASQPTTRSAARRLAEMEAAEQARRRLAAERERKLAQLRQQLQQQAQQQQQAHSQPVRTRRLIRGSASLGRESDEGASPTASQSAPTVSSQPLPRRSQRLNRQSPPSPDFPGVIRRRRASSHSSAPARRSPSSDSPSPPPGPSCPSASRCHPQSRSSSPHAQPLQAQHLKSAAPLPSDAADVVLVPASPVHRRSPVRDSQAPCSRRPEQRLTGRKRARSPSPEFVPSAPVRPVVVAPPHSPPGSSRPLADRNLDITFSPPALPRGKQRRLGSLVISRVPDTR